MKRQNNGLIEGVQYIKDDNDKINWLKMIPEEYLYINQDKKNAISKRLGKNISEVSISEVLDTELVITLQGIRYLLDLRGYKECDINLDVATPDYVAATCKIKFISNEEDFEQIYTGNASAHPNNTKSWYRNYLVEAASNRALCRAVRFYLKINIVSREELGMEQEGSFEEPKTLVPDIHEELSKLMNIKNISFGDLKKQFPKNSEKWENIKSIPRVTAFTILGQLKQG